MAYTVSNDGKGQHNIRDYPNPLVCKGEKGYTIPVVRFSPLYGCCDTCIGVRGLALPDTTFLYRLKSMKAATPFHSEQ